MIIPHNTVNQEAMARANAEQFEKEIDILEQAIFDQQWHHPTAMYSDRKIPVDCIFSPFNREHQGIHVTDGHWERIIADIKAAGYFVYRKWYHNNYFGYTKLYNVMIAKSPLTDAQLGALHFQAEWSQPIGPGGDQWRAELV